MKLNPYLTLALAPAALVAQAPATVDFAAVNKAQAPAVEALLQDFKCAEALKQAESLLPDGMPAFDKSSPTAGMKASLSFSGLTRLYLLAARAAVQDGEWEKAVDYNVKARDTAKANYEATKEVVTPLIANWTDAAAKAQAYVNDNSERVKTLKAKPGLTPAEDKEVQAFVDKRKVYDTSKDQKEKNEAAKWLNANNAHYMDLVGKTLSPSEQQEIKNFEVSQDNITKAPKIIKSLQDNIDAPKAEFDTCQRRVESAGKSVKDANDEIEKGIAEFKVKGKLVKETSGPKYDDKKAKYFDSLLNTKANYESRPNKMDKMNFLYRLRHNVEGTALVAKVDEVIDRVRKDQDPLPPAKAAKAGKGKKAK